MVKSHCPNVNLNMILGATLMVCSELLLLCSKSLKACLLPLQSIGDCDLNPMCRDHLASPTAVANFKMLALKFVLVICATCLDKYQSIQVIILLVCVATITYYMLTAVSDNLLPGSLAYSTAATTHSSSKPALIEAEKNMCGIVQKLC